ncbi:hypothetical protein DENSPDRAFT_880167 [Dentipellis sp. KUC8613]|nr:hypothetical protein DENSPDRAFT_880167 [Dentipellis sp. KUC8613]
MPHAAIFGSRWAICDPYRHLHAPPRHCEAVLHVTPPSARRAVTSVPHAAIRTPRGALSRLRVPPRTPSYALVSSWALAPPLHALTSTSRAPTRSSHAPAASFQGRDPTTPRRPLTIPPRAVLPACPPATPPLAPPTALVRRRRPRRLSPSRRRPTHPRRCHACPRHRRVPQRRRRHMHPSNGATDGPVTPLLRAAPLALVPPRSPSCRPTRLRAAPLALPPPPRPSNGTTHIVLAPPVSRCRLLPLETAQQARALSLAPTHMLSDSLAPSRKCSPRLTPPSNAAARACGLAPAISPPRTLPFRLARPRNASGAPRYPLAPRGAALNHFCASPRPLAPSGTASPPSRAAWCPFTAPLASHDAPSLSPPDPPSCPCHTRPWHRVAIAQPRALTLRCVPPSPPLKAIAPPSNPLACRRPCRHALVPLPRIVALSSCWPHATLARPRAAATHIHAAVSRPNGASRLCECSRDAAGPRLASHAPRSLSHASWAAITPPLRHRHAPLRAFAHHWHSPSLAIDTPPRSSRAVAPSAPRRALSMPRRALSHPAAPSAPRCPAATCQSMALVAPLPSPPITFAPLVAHTADTRRPTSSADQSTHGPTPAPLPPPPVTFAVTSAAPVQSAPVSCLARPLCAVMPLSCVAPLPPSSHPFRAGLACPRAPQRRRFVAGAPPRPRAATTPTRRGPRSGPPSRIGDASRGPSNTAGHRRPLGPLALHPRCCMPHQHVLCPTGPILHCLTPSYHPHAPSCCCPRHNAPNGAVSLPPGRHHTSPSHRQMHQLCRPRDVIMRAHGAIMRLNSSISLPRPAPTHLRHAITRSTHPRCCRAPSHRSDAAQRRRYVARCPALLLRVFALPPRLRSPPSRMLPPPPCTSTSTTHALKSPLRAFTLPPWTPASPPRTTVCCHSHQRCCLEPHGCCFVPLQAPLLRAAFARLRAAPTHPRLPLRASAGAVSWLMVLRHPRPPSRCHHTPLRRRFAPLQRHPTPYCLVLAVASPHSPPPPPAVTLLPPLAVALPSRGPLSPLALAVTLARSSPSALGLPSPRRIVAPSSRAL